MNSVKPRCAVPSASRVMSHREPVPDARFVGVENEVLPPSFALPLLELAADALNQLDCFSARDVDGNLVIATVEFVVE
jgi:hypothetical protein